MKGILSRGKYLRYGDWRKSVLGSVCEGQLELLVVFEFECFGGFIQMAVCM